jgi:anaerobic selenocysteine-containing dehydrogenase
MSLHYGEGANRPWLQELPDVLTTSVWGSWVEMNPRKAGEYGLRQGEIVRVVSPYGEVEAPVLYFPGNRPDLVSMPIGQGHTAYGRYANGRGANPLSILGRAIDPISGALAAGSTRVRIEKTGKFGRPVLIDQSGQAVKKALHGRKEI